MTQTPSLANTPVQTTPPGPRFTIPLHGILPNRSQDTSDYTVNPTVPRGAMIIENIKRSAETVRALPFPHCIRLHKPHHQHWNFCTIQWFQLDSTQGFDEIWLSFSQLYLTQVFDGICLRFSDLIWPNVFDCIQLIFPDPIWLAVFDGIWLRFFLFDFTHV